MLEDVVIQRHVVVDRDAGELPVKPEVLGREYQTAQRPTGHGVDMNVRQPLLLDLLHQFQTRTHISDHAHDAREEMLLQQIHLASLILQRPLQVRGILVRRLRLELVKQVQLCP